MGEDEDGSRRMSERTPGPWVRIDTPDYAEIIAPATGTNVAMVAREADADLIAAAPDLLAALQAVLAHEIKSGEFHGLSDCNCINHSREAEKLYESGECPHQIARAAIAKAMGTE